MRIAIFSDNFYPELSGISDSIILTGKELAKRGHFIHYFVPRYSAENFKIIGLPICEPNLPERIQITRFSAISYPGPTRQARAVIPTGLRWLFVKKFRPDIMHTHHIFGVGLEALIAAKILRKPLIGTNHTPLSEFWEYSLIKKDWFKTFALKYNAWYYNHCQFVSSPAQTIFDREMIPLGFKTTHGVVSNPLDLETFHPLADRKNLLKKKFGFSGFTILYAGRLAAEKRIDLIMKSVARIIKKVPSMTFAVIGKGPMENELKNLAAALNIQHLVKFMGFVEDVGIFAEIYNASDVFAIMSPAETQSLVAMQAMACGLPVIGARAWGLEEYLKKAGGLLVEPGDDKSLSEYILFLYKNPATRKKIGETGRKFVNGFSAAAIADIWEEIYENTIKSYNKKNEA